MFSPEDRNQLRAALIVRAHIADLKRAFGVVSKALIDEIQLGSFMREAFVRHATKPGSEMKLPLRPKTIIISLVFGICR